MGTAVWVVIGIVVFLGVGAHRARRKENGLPVTPFTGQSALGLFALTLGLDYVQRTREVWPYAVLLAAPLFIIIEVAGAALAKRRPELVGEASIRRIPILRIAGSAVGMFGWMCVALTVVGFASKGSINLRCQPGAVTCDEELFLMIGGAGTMLVLIGGALAIIGQRREGALGNRPQ